MRLAQVGAWLCTWCGMCVYARLHVCALGTQAWRGGRLHEGYWLLGDVAEQPCRRLPLLGGHLPEPGGHGRVIHAVAAPPRRIYAAEGTMAQRRQRALVVGLPGAGREHASSVDGESCVTGSCAPARADFACMPVDPFQQDNQSLRK